MKSLRTISSMPFVINGLISGVLVLLIFLAGVLLSYPTYTFKPQLLFSVILLSIILLFILLGVINYTFKNFQAKTTAELATDQLTGFMSRHVFGQVFAQVLAESKRSSLPLSVILVDVDCFRLINEKHNQKTGDLLLTRLGATIQETLRESDMTCRWDGDEFLIALRDCGAINAGKVAEKLLTNIRSLRVGPQNTPVDFTVSIGIAQMNSTDSFEDLIDRAQTGLYSARDNGRNTCAVGYDWILIDYYFKPIF